MTRVFIDRTESTEYGTFGRLVVDKLRFFTGELQWLENVPETSCIPAGIYECYWTYSPKLQRFAYHVEDVPDRSGILIHPANLMGRKDLEYKSEVEGCIALGCRTGFLYGQRALELSTKAVQTFEAYMAHEPFLLEISNKW